MGGSLSQGHESEVCPKQTLPHHRPWWSTLGNPGDGGLTPRVYRFQVFWTQHAQGHPPLLENPQEQDPAQRRWEAAYLSIPPNLGHLLLLLATGVTPPVRKKPLTPEGTLPGN